ncbi:hypothetical protein HanRHA438_Chr17g0824921 [Helianthus annuus]|nr:hypothetical protein HanRHA438_Chr17g0824921 [Helianthus annuus]
MTMVVALRRSSGVWYSGGWLRRTCAAAPFPSLVSSWFCRWSSSAKNRVGGCLACKRRLDLESGDRILCKVRGRSRGR